MKTKETPFLDFYEESVLLGKMPCSGLCDRFTDGYRSDEEYGCFKLIRPDDQETQQLSWEGKSTFLWASDAPTGTYLFYDFTPLRQTIVLLCAAMNDEF